MNVGFKKGTQCSNNYIDIIIYSANYLILLGKSYFNGQKSCRMQIIFPEIVKLVNDKVPRLWMSYMLNNGMAWYGLLHTQ